MSCLGILGSPAWHMACSWMNIYRMTGWMNGHHMFFFSLRGLTIFQDVSIAPLIHVHVLYFKTTCWKTIVSYAIKLLWLLIIFFTIVWYCKFPAFWFKIALLKSEKIHRRNSFPAFLKIYIFLSPAYCSSFQNQKHWYNCLRTKFLCCILFLPWA